MNLNWLNQRFLDRPEVAAKARGNAALALESWRLDKLIETLEFAAEHSPHYQRKFDKKTLESALASLREGQADEALAALPFTSPEEIAEDSLNFLAVSQDEVEGIVSVPTSGTSGQAKRIFSTAADLRETVAFFEYGMRIMVTPGCDRVALAMSPARPGNVGDLLGRGLARWNIPFLAHGFVPAGRAEESRWLEELAAWRPTCLVGVPAQMLAISRHPRARFLSNLKTMLLSGDVAEDRLVAELEKNFSGCRVFRHYGLTECGLGGAVECRKRGWPHLRDDLWVEIVDERGHQLLPGQAGEITITPLTRRGMPLIRYRTGDEGLLLAAACSCGCLRPRLKVLGRLNDRFSLPGGRRLAVADFEPVLMDLPFIRDFELRLTHQNSLEIIVTLSSDSPPEALESVVQAVREWLGPEAEGLNLQARIKEDVSGSHFAGGKRRLIRG